MAPRHKRLLHLVDRWSTRGGAYVHLLAVLEELGRTHELLVAAGERDAPVAPPGPVRLVPGLAERRRAPVALDALAAEFRPDVVHVHTVLNPTALEWAAAHGAVMTVQDHRWFCPTRGKWTLDGRPCREPLAHALCAGCFEDRAYFEDVFTLTRERLAALRGLRLVTLSDYMRAELAAAGLDPARVSVIPPFVHGLDAAAEADGPPCVLFVGRLAESKGVRDALRAWHAAGLGLPLVFAGTGPLRAELERAGCEVLGWLDRHALARAYRRARVLLMPSRWQEPFGLAGLEALSLGVPVVAWDSGGVREWHPGGDGLVPWGDVEGLARALPRLAGTRAAAPAGFARAPQMQRLLALYAAR